jgi:hypothetical protein
MMATTATRRARPSPSTNAERAVAARRDPAADGSAPATWRAPARPLVASTCAPGDSPASAGPSEVVNRVDTSEPSTATPRAPPSSRIVSLTADPTPALPDGTLLMMNVVRGGIVNDIPLTI